MRNTSLVLIGGIIILAGGVYFVFIKEWVSPPLSPPVTSSPVIPATPPSAEETKREEPQKSPQQTMPLSITSTAFPANGMIPARFTCDDKNISPELVFANIPTGTQSLALTLEDPDVPRAVRADGMWNHWVLWNIPPTTIQLGEGAIPPGILGKGTNDKASYLGPCPPDHEHRYIFTLYALDSALSLPRGATKEELLRALTPHLIEKATLIGRYNRN